MYTSKDYLLFIHLHYYNGHCWVWEVSFIEQLIVICLVNLMLLSFVGMAVHNANEEDISHWLSWCSVSIWWLWHWYCIEGRGKGWGLLYECAGASWIERAIVMHSLCINSVNGTEVVGGTNCLFRKFH